MAKFRKPRLGEQARTSIAVHFEGQLADDIMAFQAAQYIEPSVSHVVRFLVRAGLKAVRAEEAARRAVPTSPVGEPAGSRAPPAEAGISAEPVA